MDQHSLECLDFFRVRDILAKHAMTNLGRALASSVRPATRPPLIRRWHRQLVELQGLVTEQGLPPLAGISDVREIIERCAPPLRVTADDLRLVGSTLHGTHGLVQYLSKLPENSPELRHLAGRIGDFETVANRIDGIIDDRGEVRSDASSKLARIRREIATAQDRIGDVVDRLLRDSGVRRYLQYTNATVYQDRTVLPVKMEYRGRVEGIVHRTSDTGATIYVEPAQAVELNNQISNLRVEEQEEINRLLWELAHEVYINAEQITRSLDAIAVIDLIVAKHRFARRFELRVPQLIDEPRFNVRAARHPLLVDLALREAEENSATPPAPAPGNRSARAPSPTAAAHNEIVPIDYRLGEDFNLLVITGPNTGGKTVTLKTVGILALMVQAGIPVPVGEGSQFGLFRNIFIDVGDEQSMAQSLSTFSAHLTRQLDMLKRANDQTLVLIDELGAGTDPDEAAAIGRALMEELLERKCRCMVTTHIGALKSLPLTREGAENACVEFDHHTLEPTYHLRIGEPGYSNAIAIAKRLGMPGKLVKAAHRNLSKHAKRLHAALKGTVDAKRDAEQTRAKLEQERLKVAEMESKATAARDLYERQQKDFQTWVQRVVHLQPGDAVRVRNFSRDGRIVRMKLEQHRAEVDVGAFAIEVPLGDILPPEAPAPPARPEPERSAPAPHGKAGKRKAPAQPSQPGGKTPDALAGHGAGSGRRAKRRRKQERKQQPAAKPRLPSLTDAQARALQPGDVVIAKRFHREGTVVRVIPNKREVILNLGLLQVEVPFESLAYPTERKSRA